jgi:hypothetical protein
MELEKLEVVLSYLLVNFVSLFLETVLQLRLNTVVIYCL